MTRGLRSVFNTEFKCFFHRILCFVVIRIRSFFFVAIEDNVTLKLFYSSLMWIWIVSWYKQIFSILQIAGNRLADQIPLVIRFQMLKESCIQLQREMLQILQAKEKTEFFLYEDSELKAKRVRLQNCLKRLTKARVLLTDFRMNTYGCMEK